MTFTHVDLCEMIDNDRGAYEAVYAITIKSLERISGDQLSEVAKLVKYVHWAAKDCRQVGAAIRDFMTSVLKISAVHGSLLDCVLSRLLSTIDWREVGKYYIEDSLDRWVEENANKKEDV